VTAALATPWHAALGMIVFGLGTLPSMTAVLMVSHLLPAKWRGHGTKPAAIIVLLTGVWMVARAALPHEHHDHGPDQEHQHHHDVSGFEPGKSHENTTVNCLDKPISPQDDVSIF